MDQRQKKKHQTNMDALERRLAEEVRKFEHLYEPSSRRQRDSQRAVDSWRHISTLLGLDVRECMRKWKYVRDKYVRVHKRVRRGGRPGGKARAFILRLDWLLPHIRHRGAQGGPPEVVGESSCDVAAEASETEVSTVFTTTSAGAQQMWEGNLRNRLTNAERFSCTAPLCNMEDYPELMGCLPAGYTYHVCSYSRLEASTDHLDFQTTLRLPLRAVEEVKAWLKSTSVSWRVDHTRPSKGQRTIFKADYRCHHNTRPRGAAKERGSSRNTNCPAKMKITLVRTEVYHGRQSRSTDPHIPEFPTMIKISSVHNHSLRPGHAPPPEQFGSEVAQKLAQMFRAGHSPASAVELLRYDTEVEGRGDGSTSQTSSTSASTSPDLQFCYRLYHAVLGCEPRSLDGPALVQALHRSVQQYNAQCGGEYSRLRPTADGRLFTAAICSPLMRRAHAGLAHAGRAVLLDSSSNAGRQHCRVFVLLARSAAGGVPLGVVLTPCDKESVIFQGLQTLKSLLGPGSFGGRGPQGPAGFLTDDCQAERAAVHQAFPQARLLLGRLHLLRAAWRQLCQQGAQEEEDANRENAAALLAHVKKILYAKDEADAQRLYEEAAQSPSALSCSSFQELLRSLFARRESWALCYRDDGDHDNNNGDASAASLLTDQILHRTKTFNAVQLFHFLTTRLEAYYAARLAHVAAGRWEAFQETRLLPRSPNVPPEDVQQVSGQHFEVRSAASPGDVFTVDLDLDMCSCPTGSSGGPCEHLASAASRHPGRRPEPAERAELLQIAAEPPGVGQQWGSMVQEFSAMVDNRSDLQGAASAFISTFNRLKGSPALLRSAMHKFATATPARPQVAPKQQIVPAKAAAPPQVSMATTRVSAPTAAAPTVMVVQVCEGQKVPVHNLVQATQLPVVLPVPVQTVAPPSPRPAALLQASQKVLVLKNKLVQAALCDHQDYHIREDMGPPGSKGPRASRGPGSRWRARLVRNRAAASENRRRKRERVRQLEEQVAALENQNQNLSQELQALRSTAHHKDP